MAEKLKDRFGPDIAVDIAASLAPAAAAAGHELHEAGLVADALDGFDDLELTDRARSIAAAMSTHLPDDPVVALGIVAESLGPELTSSDDGMFGMEPFRYLPHVQFVGGLAEVADPTSAPEAFAAAMRAQYELTKRFTAEFSIRAYLDAHEAATLDVLRGWTSDPNEHVRRLVSEGTRPRLPWAPRLSSFVDDPTPVVELLEILRHDEAEYVRRSVANNLNDIAKDHPSTVVGVAARWWPEFEAGSRGRAMVRHGLRTLVKAGDPGALDVLGFGEDSPARVAEIEVEPRRAAIGESIEIRATVANDGDDVAGALLDLVVHFVKANGSTAPKVFKGSELWLEPGERRIVRKKVSLKQHSTRTHHPGTHRVDVQLNGTLVDGPDFEVLT